MSPKSAYLFLYNTALSLSWWVPAAGGHSTRLSLLCCRFVCSGAGSHTGIDSCWGPTHEPHLILQGICAVPHIPNHAGRRRPARRVAGARHSAVRSPASLHWLASWPPPAVRCWSMLHAAAGLPTARRCLLTAQAVELPLKVAQTAAVMEIVHSAVGLVRSPVAITGGRAVLHLSACSAAVVSCRSIISKHKQTSICRFAHPAALSACPDIP